MRNSAIRCIGSCTFLFFLGAGNGGEPKPADKEAAVLKEDLRKFEGKWEMTNKIQDRAIRSVQTIEGNKSTVTRFDEKGAVLDAHVAEFELAISGRVKVFTYFNLEVTAGSLKGSRFPQRRSFIYRLEDNWFLEAYGLLVDQREQPSVLTWRRLKDHLAANPEQRSNLARSLARKVRAHRAEREEPGRMVALKVSEPSKSPKLLRPRSRS